MRRLLVCVLVLGAGTVSYAAAASLSFGTKSLGSGGITVPVCDSDGFTYTRVLSAAHNVTSVTVSGINAACSGGTLKLTLTGAANASVGSGSVAVTGTGNATVAISPTPLASTVTSYRSAITN
jgi:hypothetical protein